MADLRIGLDTGDFDVVGDLVREATDVGTGDELRTTILFSLFTDPSWWADLYEPDAWGCRLTELLSAKHSNDTRLRARDYCRKALAWLVEDGVAAAVDVTTGWIGTTLAIGVTLTRRGGTTRYDFAWKGV